MGGTKRMVARDFSLQGPGRCVCLLRSANPQAARGRNAEVALHAIRGTHLGICRDGGPGRLTPESTPEAEPTHEPLHRASGHAVTFSVKLPPHLAGTVDGVVLVKDPAFLPLKLLQAVTLFS